jgi:hypothetical protein
MEMPGKAFMAPAHSSCEGQTGFATKSETGWQLADFHI